ncbi:hypothetical protein DPMN_125826 [Dreissena polymorpha]|uniref:EMC1 first beta-propeller domain-containing protein n=1 Tax=Dreissena polymorpha TaxID=45954 RepID=A0A9D4JXJ8_DREPO|nr:hypothetical protein DPMN_125826 [Dreissena polymorpha]
MFLYEDQVGKFDWRKQYVGQVRKLYWETERSATGGKRLYVCTDRSVIAAINTSDGDLAWRKVFEEGRRGDVDDLVYTGTSLLSVLAGTRLQAWNPAAGSLVWETAMEGDITHVGKVGYIAEPSGPGIAVGLSSTHLYGANMRDGSVLWNVELPNSDVVKYDILQVVDSVMYVIGRTSGTEVKVISVDKEGATVSSRSVLAGFLRRDTRCSVVEQMYLMCVCPASESLQVLSLQHGSVFTATSIQVSLYKCSAFSMALCSLQPPYSLQHGSVFTATSIQHGSVFTAISIQHGSVFTATSIQHGSVFTATSIQHGSVFTATSIQSSAWLCVHCNLHTDESLQVLSLQHGSVFTATSIQPSAWLCVHCNLHTGESLQALSLQHGSVFTATSIQSSAWLCVHCNLHTASIQHGSVFTATSIQHGSVFTATSIQHGSVFTATSIQHGSSLQVLSLQHGSVFTATSIQHGSCLAFSMTVITAISIQHGSVFTATSIQHGSVFTATSIQHDCDHCNLHTGESLQVLSLQHGSVFTATSIQHGSVFTATSIQHSSVFTATSIQHGSVFTATFIQHGFVFTATSLRHGSVFTATSIQDLGVREGPVKVLESTPAGTVLLAPGRSVVLVSVAANNKVTVKKHLPKALVATAVQLEDKWYLMYLQASSNEELKVGGIELETGSTLSELSHTFHYPRHSGQPELMSVILARKKDGKLGYRMAVLSQDFSLQLIHKTARLFLEKKRGIVIASSSCKVAWRREESLAYTYAVELLDLPVSENQAKFEEEFGSHADNVVTMFMKRVKTQVSQLQTFLLEHLHRLQGVKQTSGVIAEEEEEDEEDLLRDEFSLHKMMVMITEPGKIIGMRSQNGHIVWQHLVPDLAPFDTLGSKRFLLFVQRTTAHFPHQPQCVVLGKNRVSGRGQLFAFNPITGEPVSGMPGEGEHLPYSVRQAFLLGVWDEHFMKPLVMMDHSNMQACWDFYETRPPPHHAGISRRPDPPCAPSKHAGISSRPDPASSMLGFLLDQMPHVYPASMLGFLRDQTPHVYMYQADTDNSMLYGYRLATSGATVLDNNQRLNMKITNIVGKPANVKERWVNLGRVLGDRTVLYKYLNPNGEEPATQQLKVTGHMLFHGHHRKAVGPIHVVHSENWVVVGP